MIKTEKIALIGLLIGLAVILSFVFFHPFFRNTGMDCSDYQDPQFAVYNHDMNRSHTINVSVYNSSQRFKTEFSSEIDPGNVSMITFHPVPAGDLTYSVTFIVDGSIPTHYENLALSQDCTESFYLEPREGVIRPYLLWCGRPACSTV